MAIVDEHGRLFGRWNLLDFLVVILLLGLVPLSYTAYLLFHDRPPTLVSVTPARVEEAQEFHLTIKGTNLRPYMRVSAGPHQARDFLFKGIEEADAPFAHLAPGTYDLVLYDSAQERFRLRDALTVTPSSMPSSEVVAIGAFINLDAAGAAKLAAGTTLPREGQILAVGKPAPDVTEAATGSKPVAVPINGALRVPAIVKLACQLRTQGGTPYCSAGDASIAPTSVLQLHPPIGPTLFQVQRVRSVAPVETVTIAVRISGQAAAVSKIKAGDRDTGGVANELAVLATVESVGPVRVSGNQAEADIKLSAALQQSEQGWLYDSSPLRVGAGFNVRTSQYEVAGVVTDIGTPRK